MVIDNNFFMSLAINEAWKYQGLTYPNPAVGCTIVGSKNELLSVSAHRKAGKPHAEVMALKEAYYKLTNDSKILNLVSSIDIHNYLLTNHNNCFFDCLLYTTLEPCSHIGKTPSCASLISSLSIKNIFIGSNDFNEKAAHGAELLKNNGCDVRVKVLETECDALLFPFKKFMDEKFVFFKWAQCLNATTDGGIVSSIESRTNVHAMRDVCDLLVIGGNTVRLDRPMLDARLVNGKAPDVLILSRNKEFDKTIPLFNIEGRKVFVENNFSKLDEYKNIMIEGTSKMYELTRDIVDYYLCYLAPSFGGTDLFEVLDDKFEFLNSSSVDKDLIIWMKRIDK